MISPKVLVLLAGCGHLDGSEIRETIFTLHNLELKAITYTLASLDINQHHTVNHLDSSEDNNSKRKLMQESARLARGEVANLEKLNLKDFDALVIPGGFGIAKNFCDFAFKGIDAQVNPTIKNTILHFFSNVKPIMALCVAPALIALSLKDFDHSKLATPLKLTLGEGENELEILKTLNATASVKCPSDKAVYDISNRIVSSPAYMNSKSKLVEINLGISSAVDVLSNMLNHEVAVV